MLKITNPITGDELQVADQDFSYIMTWEEAKRACNELGSGWRLPNKQELKEIYEQLHEKGQGNFRTAFYWSSTEYDGDQLHKIGRYAWGFSFVWGATSHDEKHSPNCVREVRAL